MSYRFTLEPYKTMKTIHICPNCEKRTLTRYIDTENNNEYLHNSVGKCSRIIKCNYHYTPKQYFQDTNFNFDYKFKPVFKTNLPKPKQPSFIDAELVERSLSNTNENNFIHFLETKLFGKEITRQVVEDYKIGTSNVWQGATIFWQIDQNNKVKTGKIMLYNKVTGKRIKKPYNHINWVHKTEKINDFNLEQCYFGLHLINKYKELPIAIVESEKTAIISSIYLPDFIWLACGSINNLTKKKTEILKGRNVVLFPDLKGYQLWKNKIPQLSRFASYHISNLLEVKATEEEKKQGYDLADYLINLNIDYKKHI